MNWASSPSQPSRNGGALHDETKNGCEGDKIGPSLLRNFWDVNSKKKRSPSSVTIFDDQYEGEDLDCMSQVRFFYFLTLIFVIL